MYAALEGFSAIIEDPGRDHAPDKWALKASAPPVDQRQYTYDFNCYLKYSYIQKISVRQPPAIFIRFIVLKGFY